MLSWHNIMKPVFKQTAIVNKLYLKIAVRNIEHAQSLFIECSEDLEDLRKEPQESANDRHRIFRHYSSLMRDILDIKAALTLKKIDTLNKSCLSYLVASGFDRDEAIETLITTANEMPLSIAKFELELSDDIEKTPRSNIGRILATAKSVAFYLG